MAYSGELTTPARIQGFIPNVWAGDVRRFRDKKFIMEQGVRRVNFYGKQGQEYTEPLVGRAAVYPKLPGQPVVLQARTPGEYRVRIDQHHESSFGIEDIVNIQSQYNLRKVYTQEAGYALQRDLDNAVLALRAAIPTTQQIFVSSDGTAAGVPQAINDAAILSAKQYFDEQDVPEEDRMIFVSPGQYVDLLNITKFISADFVNGKPVQNGVLGSLYGYPVMSTSQIKINSLTGYVNGDGAVPQPTPGVAGSPYMPTQDVIINGGLPRGQTGNEVAAPFVSCLFCHKDWAKLLVQQNITTEASRETMLLSDVLVTSHVYGAKTYRLDHAVLIHTAP